MTDISRLKVSLTKHGAHKIADLLKAFPTEEVLDNTWGSYRDINIDRAQAIKNLSAEYGAVPSFWNAARQLGDIEIDNLVFITIIFSHHELIDAFRSSRTGRMQGRLVREAHLSGKVYTNTAHIIEELGFSVQHAYDYVIYDLRRIFLNDNLSPLVFNLLEKKLLAANWDGEGDLIDECINLNFHEAVSISEDEFRDWLSGNPPDPFTALDLDAEITGVPIQFQFSSGHIPRPGGETSARSTSSLTTVRLLHDEIQTRLFDYLSGIYGLQSVGTENSWTFGNIDIVLNHEGSFTFFEIKTDTSLRICIREALSQLMEYAYWPDERRADTLVIVSPNAPSEYSRRYVGFIREQFGIPIYYQQFDLETSVLSERI